MPELPPGPASAPPPVAGAPTLGDRVSGRLGQVIGDNRAQRLRDTVCDATAATQRGVGYGAGAALEAINIGASKSIPTMHGSDLIVMHRPSMLRGADAVAGVFRPKVVPDDYDAMRVDRPLLAETDVRVRDTKAPLQLSFDAHAAGDDYSVTGREGSPVSVYVDGQYHSDVLVLAERPTGYGVNLAGLDVGAHHVELRSSTDIAGAQAAAPTVDHVTARPLSGDAALAARFAPMLETRLELHGDPHRPPAVYTDVPLVLAPTVQHHDDGTTTLHYNLLYSNEDRGTPVTSTFRRFGRATDYEPVHTVTLDAAGNVVGDKFQGPSHIPWSFHGDRIGERPVMRVATGNGLFTSRSLGATPRWSEAPSGLFNAAPSDRDLMLAHPWSFQVMNEELQREGKVVAPRAEPGPNQVRDSRDFLYLDVGSDAARQAFDGARMVTLQLRNGSVVSGTIDPRGRMPTVPNRPALGTAVPLPKGITGADVDGIASWATGPNAPQQTQLPPGRLFVLDAEYAPHMLGKLPEPSTQPPAHPAHDDHWKHDPKTPPTLG